MPQAILDSHIHFWDPNHLSYPWLAGTPINNVYLPADLLQAAAQVDLQGIVFVQADCIDAQGAAEAEWVAELAQAEPRIRAIVAHAPLEQGEAVRPALEILAQNKLVKGIRRLIQSEPLGFCTQPDFVRGVQILPEYDLRFDICIRHPQMADAIELVRQCPQVTFVLDHFGKPGVKDNLMSPWAEQLVTLAQFPNVWCKISGLATEADHSDWMREQLRPYIQHAVSTFGIDRVFYGGDWPVSTLAIDYQTWIDTINWATPELSDTERNQLFVENAAAFYGIA
ncbi:MAG: amidohydrolase family protein [Litorilinea sp.]